MGRPPSSNSKKNRNRRADYGRERTLDKLAEFEEFKKTVYPLLQKLVANGASVEQMRAEVAPLLEARKLSIALGSLDESKALSAIIDAQNRIEGKAKERTEHTHKFQNTPDEQLDAILRSKLEQASPLTDADDDRSEAH